MISQSKTNQIKSYELSQTNQWLKELTQVGVVVIKQVLNPAQVVQATNLFWQWLQSLGTGIKRGQPETWQQQNWPGLKNMGFFCTYGGCHSKASWLIRCNPKVRQSFQKIWKSKQLITSFDTFIAWKPWWLNKKWKPHVENLHLDQNPYYKKGLKCVQGMVPLKRVRESQVGGLMVVPNSHKQDAQQDVIKRYPFVQNFESDWVEFHDNDPYVVGNKGVLVQCQAGDLILWDSRIIHGGKICQPSPQFQQDNKNQLVRLSMTVTMVPREWSNEQVLQLRQKAFSDKVGLTHWPHQFHKSGMGAFIKGLATDQIKYNWPVLEGEVKKLV